MHPRGRAEVGDEVPDIDTSEAQAYGHPPMGRQLRYVACGPILVLPVGLAAIIAREGLEGTTRAAIAAALGPVVGWIRFGSWPGGAL